MSYEAGKLKVLTLDVAEKYRVAYEADDFDAMGEVEEAAGFSDDDIPSYLAKEAVEERKPLAYLPHSCDHWVIGGPDDVRALIADLTAALEKMGG